MICDKIEVESFVGDSFGLLGSRLSSTDEVIGHSSMEGVVSCLGDANVNTEQVRILWASVGTRLRL